MSKDLFCQLRERLMALDISQTEIARQSGVQQASLSRFLNAGQATLNGEALVRLISWLGGKILLDAPAQGIDRDVCFVTADKVQAASGASAPDALDYIAAPLVGEVGAGMGFLPDDEIRSWFLVYRQLPAVRYRRNLVAVEIGPASTSMQPTLNPGDIVLVDRDDRDVSHSGHLMLVLDPMDNSGMIKRVSVRENNGDFQITFYSDNAAKWPPSVYSLEKDFANDWDRAIIGRVIWAWADVREK